MDLLNALKGAAGSGGPDRLAGQFGLDAADVEKVLGDVLPALGGGLRRNTASASSGVSQDVIKKMLPMAATLLMGTLRKQTDGGRQAQALSGGSDLRSMLGSMLDRDGDGSAIDDVLDMAKKFF